LQWPLAQQRRESASSLAAAFRTQQQFVSERRNVFGQALQATLNPMPLAPKPQQVERPLSHIPTAVLVLPFTHTATSSLSVEIQPVAMLPLPWQVIVEVILVLEHIYSQNVEKCH
jgi:hypothetical protein